MTLHQESLRILFHPFKCKTCFCYSRFERKSISFQGAGSALMGRLTKFEQIVRGMNYVSARKLRVLIYDCYHFSIIIIINVLGNK